MLSSDPVSIITPPGLEIYLPESTYYTHFNYVFPTDTNLVKEYTFYIVLQEAADSLTMFFGPYTLNVKDCTD